MKHRIKDIQHWYRSSVITKPGSGVSMHNNGLEFRFLMQIFIARYISP